MSQGEMLQEQSIDKEAEQSIDKEARSNNCDPRERAFLHKYGIHRTVNRQETSSTPINA